MARGTISFEHGSRGDVRLSDILATLSHVLDLTARRLPGHCARATYIGCMSGTRGACSPDERGYPRVLKVDGIASETRSVSVADVFDAFTADRPYRAVMLLDKALGIMRAYLAAAFNRACFAVLERALAAIKGDLARAA